MQGRIARLGVTFLSIFSISLSLSSASAFADDMSLRRGAFKRLKKEAAEINFVTQVLKQEIQVYSKLDNKTAEKLFLAQIDRSIALLSNQLQKTISKMRAE